MMGMELHDGLEDACLAATHLPRSWVQASPGEQLRTLRGDRGVSQRQLAEESGVDQAFLSRLERGADARWETWKKLFGALGYEAVLAPLPVSEEAVELLRDETQRRKERMEAARLARWG
jgi:transcriptional regulator with XRE-family HTH domain